MTSCGSYHVTHRGALHGAKERVCDATAVVTVSGVGSKRLPYKTILCCWTQVQDDTAISTCCSWSGDVDEASKARAEKPRITTACSKKCK